MRLVEIRDSQTHKMLHYSHQDFGEYRERARTMSPTILKKLRRISLQDKHLNTRPRPTNLQRNLSLQDNSRHHQESMLVGILKKKGRDSVLSAGSSEQSLSELLNEEIESISRESLLIERNPLPRGSSDFEAVMTQLGSKDDLRKSTDSDECKRNVNTPKSHGQQNRKVHWNVN